MKFKIKQSDFSKALILSNKSLLSRANLPILTNVFISSLPSGKIEVISTNLETATKVTVDCAVEKEGKITIPGRALQEFVSQLPEGDIEFEKLGEEVIVSTGGFSARFATLSAEDFPAIPKIDKGDKFLVLPTELAKGILRVAFCAAQDEGRPVLTGVLCEFGSGAISMVATDGYRLSFQKVQIKSNGGSAVKINLPAKALLEVAKIIVEAEEVSKQEPVQITVADNLNQADFKIGSVEFTSRLIEGEFPNWQKIIPLEFTSKAKILKEELMRLIKVASIFARDSGNIIRLRFESEGKGTANLKIFASDNQLGSNEARCDVELSGKGGEIAFNFRYLLEMLSSVEGEEVNFEMIESLNPGRLTMADSKDDYFHIIMPVRLQS